MADPPPSSNSAPACSPLEQEVLDEYALLLANLNKACPNDPTLPFSFGAGANTFS